MILRLLSQQYNYHLAVRYIYEIAEIPVSAYHSDIITISLFDISLWERSDATNSYLNDVIIISQLDISVRDLSNAIVSLQIDFVLI